MDLGDVSFPTTSSLAGNNETTTQEKLYGSGIFFKQESSLLSKNNDNEDDLIRGLKGVKTVAFDDFSGPKAVYKSSLLRSNNSKSFDSSSSSHGGGGSQMLCFSSPNSVTFPFFHSLPDATYTKTAYGGGLQQSTKGYFTPSQWMELEHQALIYKYINANVPIPSSLLIPIRKALDSARFSSILGLRPSTYGWGAYHLGYPSGNDPEPGRCRRTDGKKWRCAKDAVPDHKYCERHMNRGRHRSRKLVELQSGQSVTGKMKTSKVKQIPPVPSSSISAPVVASETSSLGIGTDQSIYNATSALPTQCSDPSRSILDKVDFSGKLDGLSMISPSLNVKEDQCSIPKPQNPSHESSSRGEFGLVSFDSLLNPFNKSSSFVGTSSEECIDNVESRKPQNGLHQFFTEWPNNDSHQSKNSWQDVNTNSERTQLSISIPSTMLDFMSSTSSPTNDKLLSSPPKLSPNLETCTRMDKSRGEDSWIPVNWESSSMGGGPLAEVLNNTNNNNSVYSKSPSLNLMTGGGGWDGSPYMASSPTGVLQKAGFLSSSNSSAGSSPRAATDISKAYIGGVNNLCSNVFVSPHTNPVFPNL